jgi:hypothetical protein
MIASVIQRLGWTKSPAGPETTAVRPSALETEQAATVAQTAPQNVPPKAPAAPSLDPEQVQQMTQGLAALRETVQQLAAGQDRMAREMAGLEIPRRFEYQKTSHPLVGTSTTSSSMSRGCSRKTHTTVFMGHDLCWRTPRPVETN